MSNISLTPFLSTPWGTITLRKRKILGLKFVMYCCPCGFICHMFIINLRQQAVDPIAGNGIPIYKNLSPTCTSLREWLYFVFQDILFRKVMCLVCVDSFCLSFDPIEDSRLYNGLTKAFESEEVKSISNDDCCEILNRIFCIVWIDKHITHRLFYLRQYFHSCNCYFLIYLESTIMYHFAHNVKPIEFGIYI